MNHLTLTNRAGKEIRDWRNWPRPKRDYQWEAGRSAMELARSWFTSGQPVCPPEVRALLDSHEATAGIVLSHGKPEHVTGLPESGEGRNHDLLLFGERYGVPVVVSVEAKVDETFGETLGTYWKKKRTEKKSRVPHRIEALLKAILGEAARPDQTPWQDLRYQLVTAVAGASIEAAQAGAATAIVVIHELHTSKAKRRSLAKNARDLDKFLTVAGLGACSLDAPNRLHGPLHVHAAVKRATAVDIFVGRAVYDWDASPGDG